jgi:CRP-like cAMP-binding protein
MMSRNSINTSNLLLRGLDNNVAEALDANLVRIDMRRNQYFYHAGEPVEKLYFPEGGIISCVVPNKGNGTEVAIIGKEGVTGLGALLGDEVSRFETYVQVNGSTVLEIDANIMREAMAKHPELHALIMCYAQYALLQSTFAIVTVSTHRLEGRLARWLLMCHDREETDDVRITHEFMALMISAQRSGVTMALHSLEGAGMIRSTRGCVTIRDRAKLMELAGDSYGTPEAVYRDLIAPFGKGVN